MGITITGTSGDLALIMTSFVPRVECSNSAAPPLQNCESVVDRLWTDPTPRTFGEKGNPYLRPQVGLPKYVYECKSAQLPGKNR